MRHIPSSLYMIASFEQSIATVKDNTKQRTASTILSCSPSENYPQIRAMEYQREGLDDSPPSHGITLWHSSLQRLSHQGWALNDGQMHAPTGLANLASSYERRAGIPRRRRSEIQWSTIMDNFTASRQHKLIPSVSKSNNTE